MDSRLPSAREDRGNAAAEARSEETSDLLLARHPHECRWLICACPGLRRGGGCGGFFSCHARGCADDEFQLIFHDLTQAEFRGFPNNPATSPLESQFLIPRQRWYFQGRATKDVELYRVINRGYGSMVFFNTRPFEKTDWTPLHIMNIGGEWDDGNEHNPLQPWTAPQKTGPTACTCLIPK
jgi:hypothetical protein